MTETPRWVGSGNTQATHASASGVLRSRGVLGICTKPAQRADGAQSCSAGRGVMSCSSTGWWRDTETSELRWWTGGSTALGTPARPLLLLPHPPRDDALHPLCTHLPFLEGPWALKPRMQSPGVRMSISLWDSAFNSFGYIPRSRVAGLYGSSIFNFFEESPYALHNGLHQLHSCVQRVIFTFFFLNNSHPNRCEMMSVCDFDLHFPDD